MIKLSHRSFENRHSNEFYIDFAFHVNEVKKLKISHLKTKVDFVVTSIIFA